MAEAIVHNERTLPNLSQEAARDFGKGFIVFASSVACDERHSLFVSIRVHSRFKFLSA